MDAIPIPPLLSNTLENVNALQVLYLDYADKSSSQSSRYVSPSTTTSGGIKYHLRHSGGLPASQIPYSSIDSPNTKEYDKIRDLWKKTNQVLKLKSQELADLKASKTLNKTKSYETIERNTQDLRDKLRFMERQLENARDQNDRWGSSYDEVTVLLRQYELDLEEKKSTILSQEERVRNLESELDNVSKEKKDIIGRSSTEIKKYDEGLLKYKREASHCKNKLFHAEQNVIKIEADKVEMKRTIDELSDHLKESSIKAKETTRMLTKSMDELKGYRGVRMTEQQLRVEVQHLKLDNARMVRLLAGTKEYQSWLKVAEWSNGVSFLPKSKDKKAKKGQNDSMLNNGARGLADFGALKTLEREYPTHNKSKEPVIDSADEVKHWVPSDALKLSIDFKHRHLPHVQMSLITEYLRQLNDIWRRREQSHVAFAQKKFSKTLLELRRQVSQRVPYEEILQKKQIDRLKVDLRRERKKNKQLMNSSIVRHTSAGGYADDLVGNDDTNLIETSLATVESLSAQVDQLHLENQSLRTKMMNSSINLHDIVDAGSNSGDRRTPDFVDGASWFGDHAVKITVDLQTKTNELIRKFQQESFHDDGTISTDTLKIVKNQSTNLIDEVGKNISRCAMAIKSLKDDSDARRSGASEYKAWK